MKVIELDCDGVLLDLGSVVEQSKYGTSMREQGLSWNKAVTYDFKEFPQDVRKSLFASFNDPDIIKNERPYEGADAFLKKLRRKVEGTDFKVLLRSMASEVVQPAKRAVLEQLLKDCGVLGSPHWDIEVTADKFSLPHFIYVEDCPQNLIASESEYKFLVDRSYNSEVTYPELRQTNYVRAHNYEMLLWLIESAMRSVASTAKSSSIV